MTDPSPARRSVSLPAETGHSSAQRAVLRFIILSALALSGVSCGLPTIPFLDPPQNPDTEGGGTPENRILTFTHNPNNDGDDFEGYELYYKLYTDEQTQLLGADTSFIDALPRQPGPSRLITRGFVRAVAVRELVASDPDVVSPLTSDQPPHIPTDPTSTVIEYRLDLRDPPNADPDEDIFMSWPQGGEQRRGFRRRSQENPFATDPTTMKSFWNRTEYSPEDWDIRRMNLTDEIDPETPARVSIVWYVLSYGIDGTTLSPYYSEPLRLDSAQLVLRNP